MKLIKKLFTYPLMAVNIMAALLLIFSCYGSLAAPIGKWPFASLSGLAFPFLFFINLIFLMLWLLIWRKAALVPIATFLICLSPTLDWFPLHFFSERQVKDPYITIVTYNTEGFGCDDNKDATLTNPVLKHILDFDADIVCLQEANRDMIDKASKNKTIKSRYPYIVLTPSSSTEACLSKYPVVHNEAIDFESSSNSCQYLRLLIGQDTMSVYNCHLQSNKLQQTEISEYQKFIEHPTDNTHYDASKKVLKKLLESTSQRAVQARMISDRAWNDTSGYLIVCGDFNDTPLSYSHRLFDRFMNDTYAQSGSGMGMTYHEQRLYYRIDHLFCSKNITPLYTWIDRTQKDSDHYPVISKIRLE